MKMIKNNEELMQYRSYFSEELHEDILPYWMKYGVEKVGLYLLPRLEESKCMDWWDKKGKNMPLQ